MVSVTPLRTSLVDICFCHWPVGRDALARVVPDWLTVETIDGDAWVSAIPHTVERVEAFGIDLTSPAPAVNVRTYVRGPNDQRGVYFLALYSGDQFTTETASRVLRLPYRRGRLEVHQKSDGAVRRTLDVEGRRAMDVEYSPTAGEGTTAPPDSLSAFLVERDRYFTTGAFGVRLSGSVGHDPWRLSPVEATVDGALLETIGLAGTAERPLVHYSHGMDIDLAPPTPLVESRR